MAVPELKTIRSDLIWYSRWWYRECGDHHACQRHETQLTDRNRLSQIQRRIWILKRWFTLSIKVFGAQYRGKERRLLMAWHPKKRGPANPIANEEDRFNYFWKNTGSKLLMKKSFEHSADAITTFRNSFCSCHRSTYMSEIPSSNQRESLLRVAAPMVIIKASSCAGKHKGAMATVLERPSSQFYGNWLHEGQILDPVSWT